MRSGSTLKSAVSSMALSGRSFETLAAVPSSTDETDVDCSRHVQTSTVLSRFAGRAIVRQLGKLSEGRLCLRFGCDEAVFGDQASDATPGLINIKSQAFFSRLLLGGAMGAAESYMDGEWSSPDLVAVFRMLLKNEGVLSGFRTSRFSPIGLLHKLDHLRNRNSRRGSQKNIHQHYDLGNDFFSLFLDESMMYSSAIFPVPDAPLEVAALEKVDRVCRQLQLGPEDHVVEIGTGWGGFAFHAASKYGCRVTTTTISEEQFQFARKRIHAAGLDDKVTLLKKDYRELTGQFDKLVSLEMIEAVGRQYLPQYFETCNRLLKEDGVMLLQAITMPEQNYEHYVKSVDFIQKYIFPGGFLPSISEMQRCVSENTNLRMLELNDFGLHYAKTLERWNRRFHAKLSEVKAQGFSDRFVRMWRYYLCYCEAAFLERATGLVQAIWAKPDCSLGRLC